MKKLIYALCLLLSYSLYATNNSTNDTIKIIVKGDLIQIEVDNHQELKQLLHHDLNAMFKNLHANTSRAESDSLHNEIRVEMFIQEDSVLHHSNKAYDKLVSDMKSIQNLAVKHDAEIIVYDQEIEDEQGKQIKKTIKISNEGIQIIDEATVKNDVKQQHLQHHLQQHLTTIDSANNEQKIDSDKNDNIQFSLKIGSESNECDQKEYERTIGLAEFFIGGNLYIGENNQIVSNVNHSLKTGVSVGVNYFAKTNIIKGSPLYIKYGISAVSNNYYLTRDVHLVELEDNISFKEFNHDVIKSKLVTNTFDFPVLIQLDYSDNCEEEDGFNIAIGAFAGLVGNARSKIVYKDDDDNCNKDKTDGDFYVRKFRYGLQGQFGVLGVNLFGKYHLSSLFETNKGPEELNVVEFGIMFDF